MIIHSLYQLMIQLTGNLTLNNQGHPLALTDVTKIEAVDLSAIVIKEISLPDKKLVFKNPLKVVPTMDIELREKLKVFLISSFLDLA